jgi:hypothetical protein
MMKRGRGLRDINRFGERLSYPGWRDSFFHAEKKQQFR